MSENTNENAVANTGPLKGLRVLDLTRILAGPTCTQLLGDMGADIIKIERPGKGDDTRGWGPPYVTGKDGKPTGESAYYLCANRNKRSVAVDMSNPDGAALLAKIAGECDIVVENFKVGGLKKYGLDYESLSALYPGLVYCSITGFGQTGPNAAKAGYDLMAQGYGGIMSLTGDPDGAPMKVGVGIADVVCGLYASTSILAALRHRDATGKGQHIDLALVDTQVSWLVNEGTNYLMSGEAPKRRGNQHPNIVPYQVFATRDGHAIVAVGNDGQYQRFCELIGRNDLASDERFARNTDRLQNRDELLPVLEEEVLKWDRDELLAGLDARGVPAGPVKTLPEVFETEQVKARGMKISIPHPAAESGQVDLVGNPIKMSETPMSYRRPPPMVGEHTQEVLSELFGPDALQKARAKKIVD